MPATTIAAPCSKAFALLVMEKMQHAQRCPRPPIRVRLRKDYLRNGHARTAGPPQPSKPDTCKNTRHTRCRLNNRRPYAPFKKMLTLSRRAVYGVRATGVWLFWSSLTRSGCRGMARNPFRRCASLVSLCVFPEEVCTIGIAVHSDGASASGRPRRSRPVHTFPQRLQPPPTVHAPYSGGRSLTSTGCGGCCPRGRDRSIAPSRRRRYRC